MVVGSMRPSAPPATRRRARVLLREVLLPEYSYGVGTGNPTSPRTPGEPNATAFIARRPRARDVDGSHDVADKIPMRSFVGESRGRGRVRDLVEAAGSAKVGDGFAGGVDVGGHRPPFFVRNAFVRRRTVDRQGCQTPSRATRPARHGRRGWRASPTGEGRQSRDSGAGNHSAQPS